ncbi:hypothetical protein C8J56DRAFT_1160405 [Mycena floridula]|nr:hypothetical protein C8J56DRAFT_1160405 [Mycena floridula]
MSLVTYSYLLSPVQDVTEEQLVECSKLFSENYGTWGPKAAESREGKRVRMAPSVVKSTYFGDAGKSLLATCSANGELVGHAFATCWDYEEGRVCWVTQLVVRSNHRRKGIATLLLGLLPSDGLKLFGIASGHPAALLALIRAKCPGVDIRDLDMLLMAEMLPGILSTSPVEYLKSAKLCGSLFDEEDTLGTICALDTRFFVNQDEALQALREFEKTRGTWPLGKLLDGMEFVVLVGL